MPSDLFAWAGIGRVEISECEGLKWKEGSGENCDIPEKCPPAEGVRDILGNEERVQK